MSKDIILLECTKCKELKPLDEFHRTKNRPQRYNHATRCRPCIHQIYTNNKDKLSQYYRDNKDKCISNAVEYQRNNKDKVRERESKYCRENKEKIRARRKRRYPRNKKKILEWHREKYNTDPLYRLNISIRSHICRIVRGCRCIKSKTSIKYIGCSVEELKNHLESQFHPGMTWNNHSRDGWHIDHIIPIDWFIKSDPDNALEKANHYTNLQPLWAKDNLSKGKKY